MGLPRFVMTTTSPSRRSRSGRPALPRKYSRASRTAGRSALSRRTSGEHEHVAWRVRDDERQAHGGDHSLRCHAAGPEDAALRLRKSGQSRRRPLVEIGNAEGCRVTDVDRPAVGGGEARRDPDRQVHLVFRNGAHGNHQRPMEDSRRHALAAGDVHGVVRAELEVADRNPGLHKRQVEAVAAPEQKGD